MTTLRDLQYVIEANTQGLSKAFPAIDKLNANVERLSKSVKALNDSSAKATQQTGQAFQRQAASVTRSSNQVQAALKKQEAAMISANSRVKDLNKSIKDAGAPSRLLANNARAFKTLEKTLKDTKTTTDQASIAKAKFNASLATTRRSLRDYTAQQKAAQAAQKAQDASLIKQRNTVEALRIKYEDLKKSLTLQKAHKGRIDELTTSFRRFEKQMKGGVLSSDAYSKSLTRINSTMGKVRRNAGMTDFSARMTDFAKSAQIALGPLSGVASRITAITSLASRSTIAIAGLVGGVIAFGVVMAKSVVAGAAYEKQMYRIDTILKVTNNRIGMTATEVDMMAKSVGDATMTTQGMARNAAAAFLTLRGMTKDLLEDALLAAQGLSLIGRGDIESNSRRLMRILEDPAANLKALTEAGVYFNKVEEERIRLLQESGRTDEARRAIMDRLQPVIQAATGETAGLAGAWDSFTETITTFMQDSAVAGGSVSILTSIVKDLTGWLKNLNTNTNAAIVIGTSYRAVAATIGSAMRVTMFIIDGVAEAIQTVTEMMERFQQTKAFAFLQMLDRGAQSVIETWWELPSVLDAFSSGSDKAEGAADKLGSSIWDVNKGVRRLEASIRKAGVRDIDFIPGKGLDESAQKLAAYQTRFDEAMLRINERMNDAIISGKPADIDMSVLQDAMNKLDSGNVEAAAVTLERYLGIVRDSVTEINKSSKARDEAANSWVDLRQQHLGFISEMQSMEAQLARIDGQWNDMRAVLVETGMSVEQAEAHLTRLRKEIELNGSSIEKFLNQQQQAIEVQKQEAKIAAATGAERAKMSQELKVVQALWQSGIITASNYQDALVELGKMGYGSLADEISRTTRELDNWNRAADIASMERGLIDNIKLMERELALAGSSEAERSLGLDIASQKQAMLNAGIEEGSKEWERQIALVTQLSNMEIQRGHVASVKALQDEARLQEANLRAMFYSERTRDNMVALAEKEIELANKYGSLTDARAQKELKLFQIMQERQTMIDDWKQVGEVMENAFQGAEDALVDFLKTGELNIQKLLSSISEDIFRMTFRMVIMDPLKNQIGKLMGALPGTGVGGGGTMPGIQDILGSSAATPMWVRNADGAIDDLFKPLTGDKAVSPGGSALSTLFNPSRTVGPDTSGWQIRTNPAEALTKSADKLNDAVLDLGDGVTMTQDAFDYKMDLVAKEAAKIGDTVKGNFLDLGNGIEMTEDAFSRKMELMQQEASRMGETISNNMSQGLQGAAKNFDKVLDISAKDIQDISKVGYTELAHSLKKLNPEQYAKQMQGYVDTVMNRVASPQFPNTVEGVLNQRRQFSKITGPASLDPYGSVANTPKAPDWFNKRIEDYIGKRSMGMESSVGGDLNYLNPAHSSWNNIKPGSWGDKVVNQAKASGQVFGQGGMQHFHGTAPGYNPVDPYGIRMNGMGGSSAGQNMMSGSFTGGGGGFGQGGTPGMGGGGFEQLSQSAQQASTNLQNMGSQVPQLTNSFQQAGQQANQLATTGLQPATQSFQQLSQQGLQNAMTQQITTTAQTQQMGMQSTIAGAQVQQLGMAATQAAASMQMQGAAGAVGLFHGGGVVGSGGGSRMTNLGGFKGTTPRLHGGLHPNEFRAILKRGETVFTEDQTDVLGKAISAGGASNQPSSEGGGGFRGPVNVNLYGIKDFDTFRKSKSQLNAGMQSATQQAMQRQG